MSEIREESLDRKELEKMAKTDEKTEERSDRMDDLDEGDGLMPPTPQPTTTMDPLQAPGLDGVQSAGVRCWFRFKF